MAHVYIGIGTNLGERENNLGHALRCLESIGEVEVMGKSSVLETEPVDYLDQPRFLNQVVKITTTLGPRDLLDKLKKIEDDMGRKKDIPKGPRVIDLDILLYDDIVISSHELTIPHPEIENRSFVLKHLLELDPELENPATFSKYREALKE
jgi:2-amino-4-hydroxy-6-hydroxymethyldihydropteridine diphosphokinase